MRDCSLFLTPELGVIWVIEHIVVATHLHHLHDKKQQPAARHQRQHVDANRAYSTYTARSPSLFSTQPVLERLERVRGTAVRLFPLYHSSRGRAPRSFHSPKNWLWRQATGTASSPAHTSSMMSMVAPAEMSRWTTWCCPLHAASCSADLPNWEWAKIWLENDVIQGSRFVKARLA